ncbi:MAG: hypothetical protein IT372_36240 [Polyangiaceae bacterium]|nr:hypothetical protein [Polyangiaceae bacterium]
MRRRLSVEPLRLSLLASLGLAAACGGNVVVDPPGSGGGGGGSTTTGGTGGAPAGECAGATSITAADGAYSGFWRCPDGTIHRNQAVSCNTTVNAPACVGNEVSIQCLTDAECTEKPHGKCIHRAGGPDEPGDLCGCVYPCADDGECGGSGVCVCAGIVETGYSWSTCASAAACKTGADCASGECGMTSFNDGCSWNVELACRTPGDACRVDADCGDASCVTLYGSGIYSCEYETCATGP